jgi:hypothetical protein
MGWPFFSPKRKPGAPMDPMAVRAPQPTLGMGGRLGAASDFLQMAGNEGVAQLAGTAQRFLPDMFGSDAAFGAEAQKRREMNDAVIASRVNRSGVPASEAGKIDPTDPRVRMATFASGGPLNPDAGGVNRWRAASAPRVDAWNLQPGVGQLEDPMSYVDPRTVQTAQVVAPGARPAPPAPRRRGILFGSGRR